MSLSPSVRPLCLRPLSSAGRKLNAAAVQDKMPQRGESDRSLSSNLTQSVAERWRASLIKSDEMRVKKIFFIKTWEFFVEHFLNY